MYHVLTVLVLLSSGGAARASQDATAADATTPESWTMARRDLTRRLAEALGPRNTPDVSEQRLAIARAVLITPLAVEEPEGVDWVVRGAIKDAFTGESGADDETLARRRQLVNALIADLRLEILENIPDQPDNAAKRLFLLRSIPTLKWVRGLGLAGGTVFAVGLSRGLWLMAHAGFTEEALATNLGATLVGTATFAILGILKTSLRIVSEDWHARIDACVDALIAVGDAPLPARPSVPPPR